jgi:hypothetical protein
LSLSPINSKNFLSYISFQFTGANGLFVAQAISDKEVEQGRKIINAAEKAGVEQFVYSR